MKRVLLSFMTQERMGHQGMLILIIYSTEKNFIRGILFLECTEKTDGAFQSLKTYIHHLESVF